MNKDNLLFTIDPLEKDKKDRELCKKHRDDIVKVTATNKAKLVALIEKEWFLDFIYWVNTPNADKVGPIPNHILCKNDKFDISKKFMTDFAVVTLEGWNFLVEMFKGGPKIVRNYVLNPKNGKPTVLNEAVQITINNNEKQFKKIVDPNWRVGPIKKLLCNTLGLDSNYYGIFDYSKETEIDLNLKVSEVIELIGIHWFLGITKYNENENSEFISLVNRDPLNVHPVKGESSFIDVSILALFSVRKFRHYIFDKNIGNLINEANEKGSGGKITAMVRKVFAELARPGTDIVDSDSLQQFLVRRYKNLVSAENHSAYNSLLALLDGLFEDTATGSNQGPIADIVFGVFHSRLECEKCHSFSEELENFVVLDLEIPNNDTTLEDCIANLSAPKPIEIGTKTCTYCKQNTISCIYSTVSSVSSVMIFRFIRFNTKAILIDKNRSIVTFPMKLDASSFVSSVNCEYRLVCVIYQIGEYDSEHYAVAILDSKKKWNYIDGVKGGLVEESDLINESVYMLIYQNNERKRHED